MVLILTSGGKIYLKIMKGWIMKILILVVVIVQLLVALAINYPPTKEQLGILLFLGLGGNIYLWLLRLLSLIVLGIILIIWRKTVGREIFKWSLIMLIISPTFFVLWYLFPLFLIKVLIVVCIFYVFNKQRINWWWLILLLMLGIVVYNRFILENKAAFFDKLSLKDAQNEVTERFIAEDSLKSKIELPLWWRRVAYNKYFFVYKKELAEILPFFDLESLFFQEISPIGQKSIVMWYWPEMYIFIFGIYFWLNKRDRKLNKNIFIMFLIALTDFVFSEGASYRRLLLVMWPMSLIMAIAWQKMIILGQNKYVLAKLSLRIVCILLIFAFGFNFYDLRVREEYWFDNRPLAFQFWYQNISKVSLENYQKIYISSLLGDSKAYCNFYFGKICSDKKWNFNNFNLFENKIEDKAIYAGFAGEFVGPKFKNDIDADWQNKPELKSLKFLSIKNLSDTIANQYGNEVAVAVKE